MKIYGQFPEEQSKARDLGSDVSAMAGSMPLPTEQKRSGCWCFHGKESPQSGVSKGAHLVRGCTGESQACLHGLTGQMDKQTRVWQAQQPISNQAPLSLCVPKSKRKN